MKSITAVIPNDVLDKATEGGWRDDTIRYQAIRAVTGSHMVPVEVMALDPTFWQALGKSLEWVDFHDKHHEECPYMHCWLNVANIFARVVLLGDSTDDFWKEILS
jgi:hypothetical protein